MSQCVNYRVSPLGLFPFISPPSLLGPLRATEPSTVFTCVVGAVSGFRLLLLPRGPFSSLYIYIFFFLHLCLGDDPPLFLDQKYFRFTSFLFFEVVKKREEEGYANWTRRKHRADHQKISPAEKTLCVAPRVIFSLLAGKLFNGTSSSGRHPLLPALTVGYLRFVIIHYCRRQDMADCCSCSHN